MSDGERPKAVGFIGLGDQGLPMAVAIAEAGHDLHIWARSTDSYAGLRGVAHTRHNSVDALASASEIVGLCVCSDEDVLQLLQNGLLWGLRKGSVVINHGTGTPKNARRIADLCRETSVEALDAPVSGGRPAAQERRLTTFIGGPDVVVKRCEPVFRSFSSHIEYMGETGTGQYAKLFNNTLLMMNQAAIAEIVTLAGELKLDVVRLVEVLKLGSASSSALTLLNTMVTLDNVEHLSDVQARDMTLFDQAMREVCIDAATITERGLVGAHRLPELLGRLNL